MSKYDDLMARVVRSITESIESGEADDNDYSAPWTKLGMTEIFAPINATTGQYYTGGNVGLLALGAYDMGFTDGRWATYKQWKKLDVQVRPVKEVGHGVQAVRWVKPKDKTDADGNKVKSRGLIPIVFTLHNAEQVDQSNLEVAKLAPTPEVPHAEDVLAATGAKISHGGDRAFYRSSTDEIQLPTRDQFDDSDGYYSVAFHELTHWTSHTDRCKRDLKGKFGSEAYAAEELVAELGSAMLMARLGLSLQPRLDHAQYIASWLKALQDDPRRIWTASSEASKAVKFILPAEAEIEREVVAA